MKFFKLFWNLEASTEMWRKVVCDEKTQRMTLTNHVIKDRMRASVDCINTFDSVIINYLQHCNIQLHPATLHLFARVWHTAIHIHTHTHTRIYDHTYVGTYAWSLYIRWGIALINCPFRTAVYWGYPMGEWPNVESEVMGYPLCHRTASKSSQCLSHQPE